MPDEYFKLLKMDPEKVDEMIKFVHGEYNKEMIKVKVSHSIKHDSNKQLVTAVMSAGTTACVK